jgi:hypothetical protein
MLNQDRLQPTDPADMTDQQIAHVLYEVVSSRAPASWENKTDAEIDADYARITAFYDERRPGVRLNTPPETPPRAPQRLLPPRPHPSRTPRQRRPQLPGSRFTNRPRNRPIRPPRSPTGATAATTARRYNNLTRSRPRLNE